MPKAIRFDSYGGRDVLYVADVEMPQAGPDQVVVRVEAAGINPGEAAIREGRLDAIAPATFPSGQGSDLAGVVIEVGDAVTGFQPGDEVFGFSHQRSSHAEYVAVPESQLVSKPAQVSWEVAGSLYVVAATAYAAVRAVAAGKGDTVVVSAAAGGVGAITVQLLKVRGADVIGIASKHNHDWLRSVGVTPVAYGDDLAGRIKEVAPRGVSALIDLFGPEYVDLALDLGIDVNRIDSVISFDRAGEVGAKTEGSSEASTPEVLTEMVELIADGRIRFPIAGVYPLDEVRDAYRELERGHTHGKIVLRP
jgi:NADPH2:quinone reductase